MACAVQLDCGHTAGGVEITPKLLNITACRSKWFFIVVTALSPGAFYREQILRKLPFELRRFVVMLAQQLRTGYAEFLQM